MKIVRNSFLDKVVGFNTIPYHVFDSHIFNTRPTTDCGVVARLCGLGVGYAGALLAVVSPIYILAICTVPGHNPEILNQLSGVYFLYLSFFCIWCYAVLGVIAVGGWFGLGAFFNKFPVVRDNMIGAMHKSFDWIAKVREDHCAPVDYTDE
jgi:hypothetical protein